MRQRAPRPKRLDPSRTGRQALALERGLRRRLIGQDEAIDQIVSVYQTYLASMNPPERPIGNFLFLGPTGTGKTRAVEAAAETLVGDSAAVVKIDCAEFQHSHEIAKLIGSPPGYLGHRETHPLLSQEALDRHLTEEVRIAFVLFDEIEKASDALWNLLLGILDKGTLTLGDNRRVDFSHTMVFLTSNLGASEMQTLLSPGLGFSRVSPQPQGGAAADVAKRLKSTGIQAARRKFTPEFINRLDKIVVFKPLDEEQLKQILDLELRRVQERVFASTPFLFELSEDCKRRLLDQGVDPKYGARRLKREIERSLVHPLSNLISTGQVRGGDFVRIALEAGADELVFESVDEGLSLSMMHRAAGLPLGAESDLPLAMLDATPPKTSTRRYPD